MKDKPEPMAKLSLFRRLYNALIRETLFPLFLMTSTPILILLFSFIIVNKNSNLRRTLLLDSVEDTLREAWKSIKWYVLLSEQSNVLLKLTFLKQV